MFREPCILIYCLFINHLEPLENQNRVRYEDIGSIPYRIDMEEKQRTDGCPVLREINKDLINFKVS